MPSKFSTIKKPIKELTITLKILDNGTITMFSPEVSDSVISPVSAARAAYELVNDWIDNCESEEGKNYRSDASIISDKRSIENSEKFRLSILATK